MNPGFSSTPGVQIALTRFNDINYDSSTETVEFGSGLVFDDVYNALAPYNRSVVGARVSRIGVGGFLLGGGE
jgi:FAD/FMN-containing dehydrogenase